MTPDRYEWPTMIGVFLIALWIGIVIGVRGGKRQENAACLVKLLAEARETEACTLRELRAVAMCGGKER